MVAFWILAPVMVLAALGLLFARKAVHAALLLAVVAMTVTSAPSATADLTPICPSPPKPMMPIFWFGPTFQCLSGE